MVWTNVNNQTPGGSSDLLTPEMVIEHESMDSTRAASIYRANVFAASQRVLERRPKGTKRLRREDHPSYNFEKKIHKQHKLTDQELQKPRKNVNHQPTSPELIPQLKKADRGLGLKDEQ